MYDYVIVGAGSAGCVVAHRLGEDPDVRIAVIEAGPPDDAPEIHMPLAFGPNLTSDWDWALFSEPEPGLDDRRNYLPRGRVLGGSSSLNAMIYIRGHRADYDEWAAMGLERLGLRRRPAVLQARRGQRARAEPLPRRRRAAERQRQPFDASRGRDAGSRRRARPASRTTRTSTAPPRTAPGATRSPSATAGAAAPRSPTCTRRWRAATSTCSPTRASTGSSSRASVRSAWSTCATARLEEIRAEREVILAAGSYHTPQLLMLSGVGPADQLSPLGIEPRHELPVGQNLQDHVMLNFVCLTDKGSLDLVGRRPRPSRSTRARGAGR